MLTMAAVCHQATIQVHLEHKNDEKHFNAPQSVLHSSQSSHFQQLFFNIYNLFRNKSLIFFLHRK